MSIIFSKVTHLLKQGDGLGEKEELTLGQCAVLSYVTSPATQGCLGTRHIYKERNYGGQILDSYTNLAIWLNASQDHIRFSNNFEVPFCMLQ